MKHTDFNDIDSIIESMLTLIFIDYKGFYRVLMKNLIRNYAIERKNDRCKIN